MDQDVIGAAWRQRWLILGVFLAIVVATAVISKALPKVYASTGTLIAVAGKEQTFDSVQAGQALARSYADVIDSPIIAQRVAQRLGKKPSEIKDAASFEPLTETQLLKITAEAGNPESARRLSEAYMTVFVDYARRFLSPSTGSRVTMAVPADRPDRAVRPRPTVNVVLAVVLGFPLAFALGLLRDRVRRRPRRGDGAWREAASSLAAEPAPEAAQPLASRRSATARYSEGAEPETARSGARADD